MTSTKGPGRRRARKRVRGFSLIESMVAGVMLIIGITAVVSGLGSILKLKSHQRDLTAAIHAAESTLEELMLLPSEHASLVVGDGPFTGPAYSMNMVRGTGKFSTEWDALNGPYPGTRTMEVTVRWLDSFARNRTLVLRTHRR